MTIVHKILWPLLALAILSGAVATTMAQEPLTVGMNAPVNLDPAIGTNDPEILLNRMLYDYLIDTAPDGSLVPNLATDWTISDDGLTYTLRLREGVTFHDGASFTSADVVWSFERLQALESSALALLGDFTVSAPDDLTVVFSLDTPNADFAFGLASRWSYVLPAGQDTPNVLGEGDALYANFNGTGAFILSEYRPGESATFTANPDYWMPDAPALDSVRFLFIDEQQAQIDALRTGVVDFIFKVSFDRVPELEALDGISVISKPTNQHAVIRLRVDEGRLGEDPAVVQAFKLATDRELLNLDLFDGLAAVGNNDPIGPLYGPFFTQLEQAYDPELACTLLADAGYPAGLGADEPIPFYVVDALNYQDLAINLQEQWAEGCINVDILMRPENVYYGDNEWLEVDLGITGWGSRPIPQQYLVEAYITGAPFNETHWSDAALDALVIEASLTADIEARAAIYAEIAGIFADRGPIIVPFFAPIIGAASDRVTGLDMHPFPGSTDLRTAGIEN